MAVPRFFVPDLPQFGGVDFPADEARHCTGVLRMAVGDDAILFDGNGGEASAVLEVVSKRAVQAKIVQRSDTCRELAAEVEVYVALPKGDRQKMLVEAAVQLGVKRLVPLETTRSVSQPTSNAIARLNRQVIEASKQSGRNHLMQIGEPASTDTLTKTAVGPGELALVAHPYGATVPLATITESLFRQYAENAGGSQPPKIRLVIGPEGGFTDEEMDRFRETGWQACRLGKRILRVETALLAGVAGLTGPFQGGSG